jgi:uncharacterized membrane protein YtjA (UPF0391 family)
MRWIVYSLFVVLFLNGLLSVFTREAKIGFRQNYVMHLTGVLAIAAGIIQMLFSAKVLWIIYNSNIR